MTSEHGATGSKQVSQSVSNPDCRERAELF